MSGDGDRARGLSNDRSEALVAGRRDDIAVVRVTSEGPLLVRGRLRLIDEEGREVCTRRRINALCRCGRSAVQPFCDGTHKIVPFSPRAVDGASSSAAAAESPLA